MRTALAVAGIALSTSAAFAGILNDGNMNLLAVGSAPDNNANAGSWQFPANYLANNLGESITSNYSVAGTSSFDGLSAGNSLHMKTGNEGASMHLVNLFGQSVGQNQNVIVTAGFDIWVVEAASLSAGGSIMLGGDHGGGGFSSVTDRGPQITWGYNGKITAKDSQGQDILVQSGYQNNRWQTVRLTIDLTADKFDMFWGYAGGPLTMVGDNLPFRSAGGQTQLDRFTWARFFNETKITDAYIDNVFVTIPSPGVLTLAAAAGLVTIRRRR